MSASLMNFIIVSLIMGYPRLPGTNIPMAFFILPIVLCKYYRVMKIKTIFVFYVLSVLLFMYGFSVWLLGKGSAHDLSYLISMVVQLFLNVFFGYVLFDIYKYNPKVFYFWVLMQSVLIVAGMLSNDIYSLLVLFMSGDSSGTFDLLYGLRTIGFGLYHVNGAVTFAMTVFFVFFAAKKTSLVRKFTLSASVLLALTMSRSSMIVLALFSIRKVMVVIGLIVLLYALSFVESGPIFQATEIVRNLRVDGSFRTSSTDQNLTMIMYPDNFYDLMTGFGRFYENEVDINYFKDTDLGWVRLWLFGGAGFMFLFALVSLYIPILSLRKSVKSNFLYFSLVMILLFFILNMKGIFILPPFFFFVPFLMLFNKRKEIVNE
ncbi:MAG: hypothetical protein ACRCU9_07730 [Iodobacter sp.]